jgi:hypothetical protein
LHGKSTVGAKWEGHGNLAGWRIVGGCEWEAQKANGAIVVFAGRGEAVGRFWDSESGLDCPLSIKKGLSGFYRHSGGVIGEHLADCYHPQTILAYELNSNPLDIPHGAPLRLRFERQLGYKHAKYVMKIELVETLSGIGGGKGGYWEDQGFEWYAGI